MINPLYTDSYSSMDVPGESKMSDSVILIFICCLVTTLSMSIMIHFAWQSEINTDIMNMKKSAEMSAT